jgi:hypothetical protein
MEQVLAGWTTDKSLSIEMPWETVRESSEHALSEYVLKQMRESRDNS